MKCPKCEVLLSIADRQGIEIDFCPQCRGVWLDRGELDKIIERTNLEFGNPKRHDDDHDRRDHSRPDSRPFDDRHAGKYDSDYSRRHKKKGIFGELFDFD